LEVYARFWFSGQAPTGGNYLLNVAPTPDGTFEDKAYETLAEIGQWMSVNGDGIYSTRPFSTFGEGENLRFTQSKDSSSLFVFALEWPGEVLSVQSVSVNPDSEIVMLGTDDTLRWSQDETGLHIQVPRELRNVSRHAWAFRIQR